MQLSPVILDLCLRKTRSGKSHDYCDVIIFEMSGLKFFFLSFLRFEERRLGKAPFL